MSDPLFWLSKLDLTWVPESGYGYYMEEAAFIKAQEYFTTNDYSGYSEVYLTNPVDVELYTDGWAFAEGGESGNKYYKMISALASGDRVDVGYIFKYEYELALDSKVAPPLPTLTPDNYKVNITSKLTESVADTDLS